MSTSPSPRSVAHSHIPSGPSIYGTIPHSHVFNFIHSSPLLESLTLVGFETPVDGENQEGPPTTVSRSKSPYLTGTLKFGLFWGTVGTSRLLLGLPGGLHFRKLDLICSGTQHFALVMELVAACSHTLESLDLRCKVAGTLYSASSPVKMLTSSRR